ncbi:MAG TPA: hypothetical protein VL752_03445 [Acidisoma sp.]|uniref:hypothetical protein n=1 Tax=Acidisoma sp. TaxID=1872115 RepID=UPI002BABC68C|nr:hypothetical protein [Acidisoma sp.]HTH99979.1 hypothetical protein [Acidisoma sp.]
MDDGNDTGGEGSTSGGQGPAGPGAGADEDFQALAKDWIAIWQSEITAYLTDPETQASWTAIIALWAEAAQAMLRSMPAAPAASGFRPPGTATHERAKPGPARRGAGADAAAGTASAAPASDPRDDEVRRLEQRVAELERHLAGRDGPGGETERRRGSADGDRRARGTRRRRG